MASYEVICSHCGEKFDIWDIALHIEQCKLKAEDENEN